VHQWNTMENPETDPTHTHTHAIQQFLTNVPRKKVSLIDGKGSYSS
jgi:hypothetical protein